MKRARRAAAAAEEAARDAAIDEFRQAKMALSRVLYLAAEYDAGWLTPKKGEFAEAALAANLHLYNAERCLDLDDGSAES